MLSTNMIFTINTKIVINDSNMYDEFNEMNFEYLRNEYELDKFGRLKFRGYEESGYEN